MPPISDDFARADSATSLGSPAGGWSWSPAAGTTWGISSQAAYLVAAGGSSGVRASADLGSTEHYAECRVNFPTVSIGPCVRYAAAAETFYHVRRTNSTTLTLFRCVAGSFSSLATISNSAATPHTLRLEAAGTGATVTLTVKVDGSTVATHPDSDASRITSGTRAGLRAGATGTSNSADDFAADATGSGTSVVPLVRHHMQMQGMG